MTLRPCPFCGGEPHIERRGNARFSTIISCLDCGATHECGDTGDDVGNGWNSRASDPVAAALQAICDTWGQPANEPGPSLTSLIEAGRAALSTAK